MLCVDAACPCLRAACPCCIFILHVHVCMLHVHAAYLCCLSMLRVHAVCPCCLSMLLVHAAGSWYMSILHIVLGKLQLYIRNCSGPESPCPWSHHQLTEGEGQSGEDECHQEARQPAQNILSSSYLNAIYSISTTNVLKLAVYSEKKKLYPLPHCSRLIRR